MNRISIAVPVSRFHLPDNLLDWLESDVFVSLVLAATETGPAGFLSADQPRPAEHSTKALLLYCYGRGIYSSYEIASWIAKEKRLRWLLDAPPGDWHGLRRFRRDHGPAIRAGLIKLLQAAWQRRLSRSGPSAPDFEFEADWRLRQAMFYDAMALDD